MLGWSRSRDIVPISGANRLSSFQSVDNVDFHKLYGINYEIKCEAKLILT